MEPSNSEESRFILGLLKAFGYASGYNSVNNYYSQKEF